MKSVGIITFHASHNYGSMLQAYALQQIVKGLGYECEFINFRTQRQKDLYKVAFRKGTRTKQIIKKIFYLPYLQSIYKKHQLFESFLANDLTLSPAEYNTLNELEQASFHYDYYISGSDQIWNTICYDFDWAYFLSFVKSGRKIAYAPSMGPNAKIEVYEKYGCKIKDLTAKYDSISVREKGTALRLKDFTNKDYPINLDPTLLLPIKEWDKLIDDIPLINEPYIFLYTPFYVETVFNQANILSKKLGLKVVVSQFYGSLDKNWLYKSSFYPYMSCGPKEFLNLCKNATYIIGKSFHLAVFSIILQTPFFIIEGIKDSRIANLLQLVGLESQSISKDNTSFDVSTKIDFEEVDSCLEEARKSSLQWLREALN